MAYRIFACLALLALSGTAGHPSWHFLPVNSRHADADVSGLSARTRDPTCLPGSLPG
jgi:hypothetical protein